MMAKRGSGQAASIRRAVIGQVDHMTRAARRHRVKLCGKRGVLVRDQQACTRAAGHDESHDGMTHAAQHVAADQHDVVVAVW
jgi:hypothetical protein